MSEMRRIACPSCEAQNQPLAVVDGIQEYRCHGCGMVYYGPCGCDVVHDEQAPPSYAAGKRLAGERLAGDWQMSRPIAPTLGAAAVTKYPGCT